MIRTVETAMCLWEAVLDLLAHDDPHAVALVQEEGVAAARHVVISWIDECDQTFTVAQFDGLALEPFDWEHCPHFVRRKLAERFPI